MSSKILLGVIIILLIATNVPLFSQVELGSAREPLSVGTGQPYSHIQDAIDNASDGDRIVVYNGTYYEHLTVDRQLLIIGENKNNTFIDGSSSGDVVTISAPNVNLSRFTIKKSGVNSSDTLIRITVGYSIITDNIISTGQNGISIYDCSNNLIYDNSIQNNDGDGIWCNQSNENDIIYNSIENNANGTFLYASSENTIEYNTYASNTANGIFLNMTCDLNPIRYNNISGNTKNGIYIGEFSDYNALSSNEIHSNGDCGIRIENSNVTTVNTNTIRGSGTYGILVAGSSNVIQFNSVNLNAEQGIFLFADDNNTISDNTISNNNNDGILLINSTNDTLYRNTIYGNLGYGIYVTFYAFDNAIRNNKFSANTHNAIDQSYGNRNSWNMSKTIGTNIIGGPYLGGNYWDDYTGPDYDDDGLGNTSYHIYNSNYDYLPLVDVLPPTISNVQRSPSSQTTGGYITISATVTDAIQVADVYLVIIDPDSQTMNFSITQNKTGDAYSCIKTYSTVGTYRFFITATDSRNWAVSSEYTFTIQQGIPPTITDNSPTSGSPRTVFIFNATVTDDTDSASTLTVKVRWSHGRYNENYSLVNVHDNYFEMYVVLDNTTGDLTYSFYASDQWGNAAETEQKTVSILDNEPPTIIVNRYGSSFDDLPNSYTFSATITDNVMVANATIEYWSDVNGEHITTDMDNKGQNNYEKVILPEGQPTRVYCIIQATDINGNINDTKKPTANATGPYIGVVTKPITFDGIGSFDLDGDITSYTWSFGDGSTGTGTTTQHTYSANGNYIVTLTVTDNDEQSGIDTTYAIIYRLVQIKTSYATLQELETLYQITLPELFYSYDTDGDAIIDTFVDPNDVLTTVHTGHVNISGNISFLLSIDDATIPEFFWNATTDKVIPVTHQLGVINGTIEDTENNMAILNISANKTHNWIYLEVDDSYPEANLTITTTNKTISQNMVWRKNSKVYVLDDPEIEYQFIYQDIYQAPALEHAVFTPEKGSVIDKNTTTITITYNVPVTVKDATFFNLETFDTIDIIDDLVTTDNKIFSYTPPPNLPDGQYELDIFVKDTIGTGMEDSAVFQFFSYTQATTGGMPLTWMLIGFGGMVVTVVVVLFTLRRKGITLDGFIYIKNKKIVPFFRSIIVGPVRISIDDARINKAEFYIDGKLEGAVLQPPFSWQWNPTTFAKHTLETKVYDGEGNSSSSGTVTFYMFNSSKIFK